MQACCHKVSFCCRKLLEQVGQALARLSATSAPRVIGRVHIMSEVCHKETTECNLPFTQWASMLSELANASLELHLDSDPFLTMHHLIGADALYTSPSGFSTVAQLYSTGVKLSLTALSLGHELPLGQSVSGCADCEVHELACRLSEHARWKRRRLEHAQNNERKREKGTSAA